VDGLVAAVRCVACGRMAVEHRRAAGSVSAPFPVVFLSGWITYYVRQGRGLGSLAVVSVVCTVHTLRALPARLLRRLLHRVCTVQTTETDGIRVDRRRRRLLHSFLGAVGVDGAAVVVVRYAST